MGHAYQPDFSLSRDRHLFSPGPKRILALDGGGIRGLISLGILSRIEETLAAESSDPHNFRLAHYFDLIAGTSTGSIIATALALGWSVRKVKALYEELGPTLFPPTRTMGILKFRRKASELDRVLRSSLGDMTLDSERFVTGLMICAKRIDTDSAWVLTNNPRSKFWESENGEWLPNKKYEVAMLVRASAAAPTFFEPVRIEINDGKNGFKKEEGLFVDGAVSGHNNPAVQAILTSTLPSYGFGELDENGQARGWTSGENNLLVINVGTGWYRERQDPKTFVKQIPAQQAIAGLKGMINDTVRNDLLLLQSISNPVAPWWLNSEVEHLSTELSAPAPLISYQRYDGRLSENVFLKAVGMSSETHTPRALELAFQRIMQMDNGVASNIENAFAFGRWVATPDAQDETRHPKDRERQGVRIEHFPVAFKDALNEIRPLPEGAD